MTAPFTHSFQLEPESDRKLLEEIKDYLQQTGHKIIIRDVAHYLQSKYKFVFNKGAFWCYDKSRGVWQPTEDSDMNQKIEEFLYELHKPLTHPAMVRNVGASLRDKVKVQSQLKIEESLKFSNFLNVENGMVDLKHGKLYSHDRQYYSFHQIPIHYDPTSDCPKFREFIEFAMNGDKGLEEILLRFMALVISSQIHLQYYAHIIGATSTGKSTFARVMEKLVGRNLYTCVPFYNVRNNLFALQNIVGKKLILVNELDEIHLDLAAETILKNLTGDDSIEVNKKHRDAINYRTEGRVLITSNNFPSIRDTTGAIFRRLLLFRWDRRITPELGMNWFHATNVFQTELPGILNLVVRAYMRMIRDPIPIARPAQMEKLIAEFREQSNQILQWVSERAQVDYEKTHRDWIETTEALHKDYVGWCEAVRMKSQLILNRNEFGKQLLHLFQDFVENFRDNRRSLKIGIRLRSPSDHNY